MTESPLPFADRLAMLRQLLRDCPPVLAGAGYKAGDEQVRDYKEFAFHLLPFISPSGNVVIQFRLTDWKDGEDDKDQLLVSIRDRRRDDVFFVSECLVNQGVYQPHLAGARSDFGGPYQEWLEKRLAEYLEALATHLKDTIAEKEWPDHEKVVWPI